MRLLPLTSLLVITTTTLAFSQIAKDSVIEQRTAGSCKIAVSIRTTRSTLPSAFYVVRVRDSAGKLVDSLTIAKKREHRHNCGGTYGVETSLSFVDDYHFAFAAKYTIVDCAGYVTYYGWDDKRNRQILMYSEHDIRSSLAQVSIREGTFNYVVDKKGKIVLEPGADLKETEFHWIGLDLLHQLPKERIILYQSWILATYGYRFPDALTLAHFAQKDWYKGTKDNVDDLITPHDRILLDHLKKVEQLRPSDPEYVAIDRRVAPPKSASMYKLITKPLSKQDKYNSHGVFVIDSNGKAVDSVRYQERLENIESCGVSVFLTKPRFVANNYFVLETTSTVYRCPATKNANETDEQFKKRLVTTDDPAKIMGTKAEGGYSTSYVVFENGDAQHAGTERKPTSVTLLGKENLAGIPKDRLRLMRNAVFASNGYIFKDPALFTYYLQHGNGYWPRFDDPAKALDAEEAAIVGWLKSVEDGMK